MKRQAVIPQRLRRGKGHWLSPRARWIIRRLCLGVIVLWAVTVVIFLATHALPSDPAQVILGQNATPKALATLRKALGLDKPLLQQYLDWASGIVRGHLGVSVGSGEPVISILGDRVINSLILMIATACIAIPSAIALAAASAFHRGGRLDQWLFTLSLGPIAVPEFVTGLVLVILLSTSVLHILPAVALIPPQASPLAYPNQLVLPIVALVLAVVPYVYRQARASMIGILDADYVAMARLRGIPERRVKLRYVIPNAAAAFIQASALVMTYLLGGVVIIEYLFNYPGLGSLLVSSVAARDLPVLESAILVVAAGAVLFNLIADILTVYVTPRLRTGMDRPSVRLQEQPSGA